MKRPKKHSVTINVRVPAVISQWRAQIGRAPVRITLGFIALLLLFTQIIPIWQPHAIARSYNLGDNAQLLPQASDDLASKLVYSSKDGTYNFNAGYGPSVQTQTSGGAHISATANSDASKGITVTDPVNKVDFDIKPQFELGPAKQQQNRIVYPFNDGTGWLVYSMQAGEVKENILLKHSNGDKLTLKYTLGLGDQLTAKMLPTGAIAVYGDTILSGNVSTGSAKDQELLQKARQKAPKSTLLFVIPAPTINEDDRTKSSVQAHYELNGDTLTLTATGLKKADYPLAIDPSVFVTTAQQFMQGNNESNIDYDTSLDLIQKGKLTGARLSAWSTSMALPASRWSAGNATGGGYQYVVGGASGGTNQSNVYWAHYDPTANNFITPGTCASSWCTNTAFDLPAPRSGLSSVVYNGYLYAIGGTDAGCTAGSGTGGANAICNTVYYAKLSANGEPISWTTGSTLVTARRFAGIVAYNNKLYLTAGQTNTSLNGDQTTEMTNVNPDGSLTAWTTTGTTNIPTAGRWGETTLQYNGYLYLVGGASTTTAAATVQYIKINSDGTMASSWVSTSSFTNARMTFGGNFATIYGGYLYITTGCTTLTTTACSTFTAVTFTGSPNTQTDFQYASINADGSLTGFTISAQNTTSSPVVNGTPLKSAAGTAMTGYGLTAWRGALYAVGGCTAVSTATNCSGTTQTQTDVGPVNSDGDISPIFGSPASDFTNGTNYLQNLPAMGTGASQGGSTATGVVINNGFIYNVGGCADEDCAPMSDRTSFAAINSDGTLAAPGTCGGTLVNTIWCLDTTHLLPVAIGAMGITVYDNVIYTSGGFTGAANTAHIYHVPLSANGALGAWVDDGTTFITTAAGYIYTFIRSIPNNATQSYYYMIGGCVGTTGIGCTTTSYVATVKRCTITNGGGLVAASCNTAAQLQLLTGTGIFGGAVYGNYIYLAGGANGLTGGNTSPSGATCTADPNACGGQMDIVEYAMVNSSGNITRTDGTTITGGWQITSSRLPEERRRTTAVAMDGYLYIFAGHNGNAPAHTLNDIVRGKINVNTGDVTGLADLTTTITDRWDARAATANGYVYMLGGCTAGPPPNTCTALAMTGVGEYVQDYNNWSASPAAYTSSTNRPTTDRFGGAATVLNGYLYLAGGCTTQANDCSTTTTGTATTDVTFSQIAADGSIGAWNVSGTYALPAARAFGRLENVGGTLYYMGGETGAGVAQTSMYYSTPNTSTGVPAAWASTTTPLAAARSQFNTTVYNNRIYLVGGYSGTNATATTTVYYTDDLSAGGNFTGTWNLDAGTSFSVARSGEVAVAYGNNLYVMGGFDGTNYLLDVQYAPIADDGSIGTWGYGNSLPQNVRQGDGFATNGYLYLFAGRSSTATSGCTANTYDAPINADGSIGTWSQTSVTYNIPRSGVAAAYSGGRTYLLGGLGCAASVALTGNDRAVYGTLQLQPQIANYSLKIDTDSNVFPSKYLINGLDNGIGASWFLKYQSSTTAAASWGQATNVGVLALKVPGTYTPLDGGGTDTNTTVGAQYYNFLLTIDDQNAFGFPEDVTRGPNITDITLQFTSDPSKRLRNGKTFTGGVQQPLDTPF